MLEGLEIVQRVNALARDAGVVQWVDQFDNVATQSTYRLPYVKTSRYVKPGDQVLDWGCGNGHFSFFLESIGAKVTGYSFEPAPRSMQRASAFSFVPGSDADPRTLPFADGTFDAAVGVGVLEHVWETGGDELSSLRELARVLKPGGTLLTFHFPNRTGIVEQAVHALRLKKHFHVRKYDATDIATLWTEAGFRVLEVERYDALPRAELRRLPAFLRKSTLFAKAYVLADGAIAAVMPRVCTNYLVVAKKPDAL